MHDVSEKLFIKNTQILKILSIIINSSNINGSFFLLVVTFSFLHLFLQLKKCFDTPLVYISPVCVWSADQDAFLTYTIQEDFMSSTWDWIGLYKVMRET